MKKTMLAMLAGIAAMLLTPGITLANDVCIECHTKITPGMVKDYNVSAHAEYELGCAACHGEAHKTADDSQKAAMPDEALCGGCHPDPFDQFSHGKHNFGWTSLNALPVAHLAPDELIESATSIARSELISEMTTDAPCSTNASAIALPIPVAAPVIKATFLSKSFIFLLLSIFC